LTAGATPYLLAPVASRTIAHDNLRQATKQLRQTCLKGRPGRRADEFAGRGPPVVGIPEKICGWSHERERLTGLPPPEDRPPDLEGIASAVICSGGYVLKAKPSGQLLTGKLALRHRDWPGNRWPGRASWTSVYRGRCTAPHAWPRRPSRPRSPPPSPPSRSRARTSAGPARRCVDRQGSRHSRRRPADSREGPDTPLCAKASWWQPT
jgi:hypothetical protein